MGALAVIAAVAWGLLTGLALPRAAYRLSVESEQPPRGAGLDGEPLPAGWRGWVGPWPGGPVTAVACTAVCAVACGGVALVAGPRPELAVWLLLVPLGVLLARIDLAVHRLPDLLTLPAAAGTAALLGCAALLPGHGGSYGRALLGGLALAAAYVALFLINPAGLGFGDVKLAPTLGLALGWYGWDALFTGTVIGFVLGALVGLALLAAGRATRKTPIPFGPFMLLGAWAALLLAA
jgi:leader peptidase (prepilin peptidase) / N-methyltransferase